MCFLLRPQLRPKYAEWRERCVGNDLTRFFHSRRKRSALCLLSFIRSNRRARRRNLRSAAAAEDLDHLDHLRRAIVCWTPTS